MSNEKYRPNCLRRKQSLFWRIKRSQEPSGTFIANRHAPRFDSRYGSPLRAPDQCSVYQVLNRANGRLPLFDQAGVYEAFERVLAEAQQRFAMRVLAHCVMPNQCRLLVWPHADGLLSTFTGWLTLTHPQPSSDRFSSQL